MTLLAASCKGFDCPSPVSLKVDICDSCKGVCLYLQQQVVAKVWLCTGVKYPADTVYICCRAGGFVVVNGIS